MSEPMRCPRCFRTVEPGAKFCTTCGTQHGAEAAAAETPTPHIHAEGDVWICEACQAENPFDDAFCTHCGKTRLCFECGRSIPVDEKFCEYCGTEAGKWICTRCGSVVDAKDLFCELCGTKRHKPGAIQ